MSSPIYKHPFAGSSHLVRAFNIGSRALQSFGLAHPSLDEVRLLRAAEQRTGLRDFGDGAFHEPLRRLLRSYEEEARLSPLGRIATREDTIRLLATRLRLEDDRKRHPEIEAEVIRRPLFITGFPRTGTTLLHNLMALDPSNRVPLTWEAMFPSPPPEAATCETDPRIAAAERQIRWFRRLATGFERIHPVGAMLPEECLVLTSHSFRSFQFETTHRVPAFQEWLERADLRALYEAHRRLLQHLQWRASRARWVLKAPAHLFGLEALFSVYPDAGVVVTHRDPIEVAASNASLTLALRRVFSDATDPAEVGPECSRRWAQAMKRAMDARDSGCAPPDRFLDVRYADLTGDPSAVVERIYAHFGIPFPTGLEERIRRFAARNPKDRFGRHRYSLEEFGLDPSEEAKRYSRYRQRYGV